jgi:hypothetical protein
VALNLYWAVRSNVLPKLCILEQDFFTESSKSALRAVFASWSLDDVKHWSAPRFSEC